MHITAYFGSRRCHQLYRALQLFFAALYAFLLPFICAGAQATPGHPHARAHFVFLEPEFADHQRHAGAMDDMGGDMGATHTGYMASVTELEDSCPLQRDVDSPLPAGRSVSMQLVTSSLILLGSSAALIPLLSEPVGFSVWLADSMMEPFHTLVPTPPPR